MLTSLIPAGGPSVRISGVPFGGLRLLRAGSTGRVSVFHFTPALKAPGYCQSPPTARECVVRFQCIAEDRLTQGLKRRQRKEQLTAAFKCCATEKKSALALKVGPCGDCQQDNRGDPERRIAHSCFLGHEADFNHRRGFVHKKNLGRGCGGLQWQDRTAVQGLPNAINGNRGCGSARNLAPDLITRDLYSKVRSASSRRI
jgi:hypothetical protein